MSKKGIFVISIDVEMAWGTFDHGGHLKYADAYKKYRFIISELLKLFKKYDIAATWAIVGHLFLDACAKESGRLHPDIVRPAYSWYQNDWFTCDPGSDISKDDFWYGSDIVKMIQEAAPAQEIASHSFCHLIFSDPGCSKQAAESDIVKCAALAKEKGIRLNSFVFPRNSPGHLKVLADNGFRIFRGRDDVFFDLRPGILRKVMVLLGDMSALTPPVVEPHFALKGKLIELRGSMLFRFAHGASRFIPNGVRLMKAKKGIDRAIREGKVFNLWCHPISFAWDTDRMLHEFKEILEYASGRRHEGKLKISTLEKVGDMYLREAKDSDSYNPAAIRLHNDRSRLFRRDYSDDLSNYYSSAFKYGRKKVNSDFLPFLDSLNEGSRILEVGSGTGYYLNLMQKQGFDCSGIDIAEEMIQQARTSYPAVKIQRADARTLPFLDGSFDAVVSIETLRYFSDRDPFLREILRVLKPGGRVFITAAPLFSMNAYGIFNTFCRLFNLKSFVSCFQSFETSGSLRYRLERTGFETVSIKGRFFGPYFLLDKVWPKFSSFLMEHLERLDDGLGRAGLGKNFSNHLVAIAEKPRT